MALTQTDEAFYAKAALEIQMGNVLPIKTPNES